MNWHSALHPIPGHGSPPAAFLDELLLLLRPLPDALFAPNGNRDIYSLLSPVLGPWSSIQHRKAVMAEALIVDGGFESDWNWLEGADSTAGPETPSQEETGLWQVSADSMGLDPSLRAFIGARLGTDHPAVFIQAMKSDHALAVEYVIRLFRVSTRWSGPSNTGKLAGAVTRNSVAEWQLAFAGA